KRHRTSIRSPCRRHTDRRSPPGIRTRQRPHPDPRPISMTLLTVPPPAQPLRWLGGPIDVRVEVDTGGGAGFETGLWDVSRWGEALWGSVDPDWQDMTRYVIEVTIDRGAERWGQRFRVGTCSIVVDNTDGFFTPGVDAPSSPFFREFRPGRRIRVVALPDP